MKYFISFLIWLLQGQVIPDMREKDPEAEALQKRLQKKTYFAKGDNFTKNKKKSNRFRGGVRTVNG